MNDLLLQGLTLSALGLGLTFAALGVFILVILGLQRAFAARPAAGEAAAPAEAPAAGGSSPQAIEDEAVAAAICIALSQLRSREICESGLGEALSAGRGPWWQPTRDSQTLSPRSQR